MLELYRKLGIRDKVLSHGEEVLKKLEETFRAIDETAEYNQLQMPTFLQNKPAVQSQFKSRAPCR